RRRGRRRHGRRPSTPRLRRHRLPRRDSHRGEPARGVARHRAREPAGDRRRAPRIPRRARRPDGLDRRGRRRRGGTDARRRGRRAARPRSQGVSGALRVRSADRPLTGTTTVPGDKSLGHRALLLSALADGSSTIRGFPGGADVRATLGAMRALGASIDWDGGDTVRVEGRGLELGVGVDATLDCANSGTTMRLAAGLVAAVPGRRTLDGDASLRRRPMERVAEPLRRMGARIETTAGRAPLTIEGAALAGVGCTLEVASAQVKSALLLAGLRATGTTRVVEPLATRDHTERMLRHMGVPVVVEDLAVAVTGGHRLAPL